MNRNTWIAAFTGIMLLAAGTRLLNLTRMSLWGDEACMVYLCQETPGQIIDALASPDRPDVDVAPPVYFILLNRWFRMFGTSVTAFRGFSAIFGIGLVLMAILATRRLFDEPTAIAVGVITAVNPFQVWYSQEGRMYSLAAFLAAASIYYFVGLLRNPQAKRDWIGFAAASTVLVYTQYYGFLFAGATVAYLVWHAVLHESEHRKLLLLGGISTGIVWILAYLPWFPVLILDYTHAGKPGGFPAFFHPVISPAFLLLKLTVYGNEMYIRDHIWLYGVILPVVAAGLGAAALKIPGWRFQVLAALILLPFAVVYAGSLAGLKIYKSHPFIIFQLPLLMLLSVGLIRLRRPLNMILFTAYLAANIFVLSTTVTGGQYVKPRVKDAVTWIAGRFQPTDTVAVVPAFIPNPMPIVGDLLTFRYHADHRFDDRVIYLVGDTPADFLGQIRRRVTPGAQLFVVFQDNPQVRPHIDALSRGLMEELTLLDSVRLESRLRGFSLGILLLRAEKSLPVRTGQ